MANNHRGGHRVLLCLDLSYQSYRAAAAHPRLTSGRHFTGGLYGFWVTMAKLATEVMATDIVVCEDSKPYVRSLEYPDYKANRAKAKKTNEELVLAHKASMVLIRQTLDEVGIPRWSIPGFESDDLIGAAAMSERHRFHRIYAGSKDSDLWQLLKYRGFRIRTAGPETEWTEERLLQEHGITPDQYMLATALAGTHNAVDGIPKVGAVTSIKAVKDPGLMRQLRDKHAHIIDRNLGLIKLPHPKFPDTARIPRATASFDARVLYRALGRFDIEVTHQMSNAMERVLK